MKRRVIVCLIFDTKESRDAARQSIEKDHEKKTPEENIIESQDQERGNARWILRVDASFKPDAKADGDDSYAKIKAELKAKEVVQGEVSVHDCTHDDPVVKPCTETNYESKKK